MTSIASTLAQAWTTALHAASFIRKDPYPDRGTYGLDEGGRFGLVTEPNSNHCLEWNQGTGWNASPLTTGIVRVLLDLYLPMCNVHAAKPMTVGHLGQSLDGYIATKEGDSMYVSGPENIRHLHRMRALSDAIVVGAETVATDNPRLTTRLVSGNSPTRVVIDPQGRLPRSHAVFSDQSSPTLWVRDQNEHPGQPSVEGVEVIDLPTREGTLDLEALLEALHQRGLYSVFVEGGGKTVSHFLQAGLLDRLQIAVAPMVIGTGRRGITLEGDTALKDCLRPTNRVYRMGNDMLFDMDMGRVNNDRPCDEINGLDRIL